MLTLTSKENNLRFYAMPYPPNILNVAAFIVIKNIFLN